MLLGIVNVAGCGSRAASGRMQAASGGPRPGGAGPITLRVDGRTFAQIPVRTVSVDGRLDRHRLALAVYRLLPKRVELSRGVWRFVDAIDRPAVIRQVEQHGAVAQEVTVPVHRSAASARVGVVKQILHNDCESAALQMLLATRGVRAGQLTLQSQLPRSGPLDPVGAGRSMVWGDPQFGFVGRADGGGTAGGFGVYQGPIATVARRHGVTLRAPGPNPRDLYAALLRGRAVMAWVALSNGPYGDWTSPSGTHVHVNFGEHAVVLLGLRPRGLLEVGNPLTGHRELWSEAMFEQMWDGLGRRSLAATADA